MNCTPYPNDCSMRNRFKGFRPLKGPPTPEDGPFRGNPPAAIAEAIGFQLGTAAFRALGYLHGALESVGIEPPHHAVLLALERDGPQAQKTLSDTLNFDRTTMVHLLDALGEKGYIRRDPDPNDRRAHAVQLTEAGAAALAEANAHTRQAELEFLSPLTAEEQGQLRELLQRLIHPTAPDASSADEETNTKTPPEAGPPAG